MRQFDNFRIYKEFEESKRMALFKVFLVVSAAACYDILLESDTDTWEHMKAAFEACYISLGFMKYKYANNPFNTKQGDSSVDDFCVKLQRLAREVSTNEEMLHFAVINWLKTGN